MTPNRMHRRRRPGRKAELNTVARFFIDRPIFAMVIAIVTVILGIGGIEKSIEHAMDTASLLTEMDPDYVGALTLMLVPQTEMYEDYLAGRFVLPDKIGFIRELYLMIANANFTNCYFTSNHASNYLPIKARLPGQKEKILKMMRAVIEENDVTRLRPEFLRGL